jgi:hypothetical protein
MQRAIAMVQAECLSEPRVIGGRRKGSGRIEG